jgi:hypothetical protein
LRVRFRALGARAAVCFTASWAANLSSASRASRWCLASRTGSPLATAAALAAACSSSEASRRFSWGPCVVRLRQE